MKKPKLTKKQKAAKENRKIENVWIIATIVVAVGLIILFLGRGWLRMSVAPWVVTTTNGGNPTQKVIRTENQRLNDPMRLLGFGKLEEDSGTCATDLAEIFSTEVHCDYQMRAWRTLAKDTKSKQIDHTNARILELLLDQNGWALEDHDAEWLTTLPELVSDTHAGTQILSETASYTKRSGDVLCYLTIYAIDAQTKHPGIGATFSCSSEHYFFGKPFRGP